VTSSFEPICEKCEELIQPYLDRELSEAERLEAEGHLADCGYCTERYRFEASLRQYVRQACCQEEMSSELKAKLASLRTPLDD
jgi:anti-sigma factor (TIGR02949 family)